MLKQGRLAVVTMALLAWVMPARAADLDDYLPNDTEFVLTVNVRQILDSQLFKKHVLELAKGALLDGDAQKTLGALGFDPLKDIDSIVLASPGGDERDKGLIIVHGKFNVAKFKAAAKNVEQLKPVKAGDYSFWETPGLPGGSDMPAYVALVDDKTIVMSPGKSYVVTALDIQAGKKESKPKKDLEDVVDDIDEEQSIWVAALSTSLSKSALAKDDKAKEVFDKFESIAAGLTIADGVTFQVDIDAKDDKAASDLKKQISDGLDQAKTLVTILTAQKPEIAGLADVLNTLKVKTKDSSVLVKGIVPAELIEKAIKQK